jgi:hypothetical protein
MQRKPKRILVVLAVAMSLVLAAIPALAQQVTGVPGSPNATTTISGKQLPPPDPKFGGVIKDDALKKLSGLGRPGTGTLKVDGKAVQAVTLPHTLPMILQWDESFDIGSDTLTGVNDADYQPPFPLMAKLNKLTINIDRPKLTPEDIKKLDAAQRNNKVSE